MELLQIIYILIVMFLKWTVLGPVLFSIMVDDIKTAHPNNALVKFTDDLTLGVPGNESGDTSRSEAVCLQDWADENRRRE
jgi:hypothetical protein